MITVNLAPQGDEFLGSFTTTVPGEYQIRFRASGSTDRGLPFTRERAATVGVWRGGDTPPRGGPNDLGTIIEDERRRRCAFLHCLLQTLSKNEVLRKRLHEWGIEPRDFLKCLDLLCKDTLPPYRAAPSLDPDEVNRLLGELQRVLGGRSS